MMLVFVSQIGGGICGGIGGCVEDDSDGLDSDFTTTEGDTFPSPVTVTETGGGTSATTVPDPTADPSGDTTPMTTGTATEGQTDGSAGETSSGAGSTSGGDESGGGDTGQAVTCGNATIDSAEVCFGAGVSYALGGTTPIDVVAADFDGDGHVDVATANLASNDVSVLLGAGDGTLGGSVEYAVGTAPIRIQAGRLDPGNARDLVTVNEGSDDVSVLLADGAGGFSIAVAYPVGSGPVDLALGDLTGDSIDDLAVANVGSGNYSTASNDGSGVLTVWGPWSTNGVVPRGIAIGDIALAGNRDVWFGGANRYAASPGQGDGTVNDTVAVVGMTGTALGRASGGDVDENGDLDVVAIDEDGVCFLHGGSTSNIDASFMPTALTAGAGPSEALLVDVTGEGHVDIVVANAGDDTVSIFVGDGTGLFDPTPTETLPCGLAPSGLAVAHLDDDGVRDIVCANELDHEVTVLLSNP